MHVEPRGSKPKARGGSGDLRSLNGWVSVSATTGRLLTDASVWLGEMQGARHAGCSVKVAQRGRGRPGVFPRTRPGSK